MTAKITVWLVVSVLIIVLGWDAYVASNDIQGDTVSEFLERIGANYPIVTLLVGLICGHLWWPMIHRKEAAEKISQLQADNDRLRKLIHEMGAD